MKSFNLGGMLELGHSSSNMTWRSSMTHHLPPVTLETADELALTIPDHEVPPFLEGKAKLLYKRNILVPQKFRCRVKNQTDSKGDLIDERVRSYYGLNNRQPEEFPDEGVEFMAFDL
jgi:hypothetical protein